MTKNGALPNLQDPAWGLLTEFSLPSEPGGEQQLAERVSRAVQELGLPPAQVRRIEQAIQRAVRNATHRVDQDQLNPAVSIRVWISRAPTEGPSGSRSDSLRADQQKRSGWGFFVIEKGEVDPQAPDQQSHPMIELFLYQERARFR